MNKSIFKIHVLKRTKDEIGLLTCIGMLTNYTTIENTSKVMPKPTIYYID